jgi:hypothetical protein
LRCFHWHLQFAAVPCSSETQQLDFADGSQQLVFSSALQQDSAAIFAALAVFAAKKCWRFSESSNESPGAGGSMRRLP